MRRLRPARLTATCAALVVLVGCGSVPAARPGDAAVAPSTAPGTPSGGTTATGSPRQTAAAPQHPFEVGVRRLSVRRSADRALKVTLWYPAVGRGGTSARPAPGRFPVVLFSHGLAALPADYAPLLTAWAAAGFVVAAPVYPHTGRGAEHVNLLDVLNQPADASYVLTEVLAADHDTGDPLHGHLATSRVGAAGHSAGGITTVGMFTLGRDERLDAGIVLAGSALGVGTAFSGTAAPQLFIHGQLDDVVSYPSGKAAYDAVPWPKALVSLPDGNHGRGILRPGDPAFRVVADTTVEFLRWTLYGDPAAKRRLPATATRGGLAYLDDRL